MTIIKKFDNEELDIKPKFPKFYVFLSAFFLLILVLVEIWVNNTFVSYGEKFDKMDSLVNTLNIENQLLENEIAKYSSLRNISSKSAELGFSQPASIQYIR